LAGVNVPPDVKDDIDVVGDEGSDGYRSVGNGRFNVT